MSAKDQYIDLCEARVSALEKELNLMTDWIVREHEVLRGWSKETTLLMFNTYKAAINENEAQ